jgi:cell division ATPase FtsA
MFKLTIETETAEELKIYYNANLFRSSFVDILNTIRNRIKHSDEETITLEEVRNLILNTIDENGLTIYDVQS